MQSHRYIARRRGSDGLLKIKEHRKDIRESALYREAEAFYEEARRPGSGLLSDASEVMAYGSQAIFTGSMLDRLDGAPVTRICRTDLESGDTRVLTFGPNCDRSAEFSPDGRQIAFLSDRHRRGDFQLYILDPQSGAAHAAPRVDGWVEYAHWSPSGRQLLLGVAGHGADLSSGRGGLASNQMKGEVPSWMPEVQTGSESYRWRDAYVYELGGDCPRALAHGAYNVWEATWCGPDRLAAVVSLAPHEGSWYDAYLCVIETQSGECREIYRPQRQLACLAGSIDGKHLAFVESVCSDRELVCGDLRLLDLASGVVRRVDTRGVDVSFAQSG